MKNKAKAAPKAIGSPSAFRANPYITASTMEGGVDGTGALQGRQLHYETTIIKSPVLRSARNCIASHALTKDDLDSLTTMMSNLQVRGNPSSDLDSKAAMVSNFQVHGKTVTTKSKTAQLSTSTSSLNSNGTTTAPTPPPSPAVDGRYDAVVFSPKKKMHVPVKRSARFRKADS